MALATLAGYRQAAQLYQQAEDLVRKELLWARSTQLKRLRLQVEDMIKTTIKEKEEEAERLSSLGTRAVISLDIQRIEEAVTLYARAAEIVKEFDSSNTSMLVTVVVSLFTEPKPLSELAGVVYGATKLPRENPLPIYKNSGSGQGSRSSSSSASISTSGKETAHAFRKHFNLVLYRGVVDGLLRNDLW